MIESYKDLTVWQKSMDLVVDCYHLSKQFPNQEMYGLTSQLRRAAVSVPANIAEGKHRHHLKEFIQHLSIALGSLAELETHCILAKRLNFISDNKLHEILDKTAEIGKMLNGLKNSLNSNLSAASCQGSGAS